MKNIHIIPTDKPTKLFTFSNKLFNYHKPQQGDGVDTINKNIYITNDEEIKEGDWVLLPSNEIYKMSNTDMIHYLSSESNFTKKIILTTDHNLVKDSIQAIPDEFLEWFVKNQSCEEVEVKEQYFHGSGYYKPEVLSDIEKEMYQFLKEYKIIIPKEEPIGFIPDGNFNPDEEVQLSDYKQETLEEAAKRYYNNYDKRKEEFAFIDGAKWQQERSYSEEEILKLVDNLFHKYSSDFRVSAKIDAKEWFEQFKTTVL